MKILRESNEASINKLKDKMEYYSKAFAKDIPALRNKLFTYYNKIEELTKEDIINYLQSDHFKNLCLSKYRKEYRNDPKTLKDLDDTISLFIDQTKNLKDKSMNEATWSPVEYDEETGEYYSRPGNEFDGIDPQTQPIEEARMSRNPYGINDVKRLLNNKAPEAWWGREEIEMDFGDGSKLANYLTKKGIDVKYNEEDERWFVKGKYNFGDCYFYPYPYRYENELNEGLQYIESINSRKGIRAPKTLTETYHINDEEVMNKVAELGKELESQGFKYVSSKDSRDYYDFYRKIEDGKGVWKAVIYNYGAAEIIDITYEQARGIEPIDSLEQLRKDLGKILLPNNSINESNVKNIYYHDDLGGIKRGQWLNVKEQDGRTYAKWNFEPDEENNWSDVTDSIKELPYHNFVGERPAKMFSFGGWRHWMDDEVDKFYEIEKNRIDPDFKIGECLKEKLQNEKEDASEEKEDAKLNEDIEVPTLEGPNEGAEYGLSELLNTAIQHELETVNEYNVLALNARAEGYEDIASIIDEINTEENKHIGQLQELLKTISPNAQAIVVGETEASDDLVNVEVE